MIGKTIGKYRIIGQLGRGGAGIVYKAVDETLNREVAVKALNPDLEDTEVMTRFRAEATILAKLNHPQIATIYELFRSETDLLMVMEFVRGEALDKLSERLGPLSPEGAAYLIELILSALEHAHRAGIVHRDVKPANVMVTDEGGLKIMDFGIARVLGAEQKTVDGRLMGTPAYMSPEQVLGGEVDGRADLYSVGVLLYRLLTGALPFTADTALGMLQRQIRDTPTPLAAHRAGLPDWCEPLVQRALAKSPADRFQSAEEFREAMTTATGVLPTADLARMFAKSGRESAAASAQAMGDTVVLAHAAQAAMPVSHAPLTEKSAKRNRLARAYPAFAVLVIGVVALGYPRLWPSPSDRESIAAVTSIAEAGRPVRPELTPEPAIPADFPTDETVIVRATPQPESDVAAPVPSAPMMSEARRPAPIPKNLAAETSGSATARSAEAIEPRRAPLTHEPSLVFETNALVGTRKPREQSAQLMLGEGKIIVIPQANPTSRLAVIPYDRVISISVSRGRDPLWNSPQGPAPVARAGGRLGKLGISITRDWISLRTSTEEQFVALRFDEVLLKRVLLALEERTGRTPEVVVIDKDKRDDN